MANQPYLAMTAAEFSACTNLPEKLAWMACHFSPYGRGMSNIPRELPPGSMLMLNDRIEPQGIDPDLVANQLRQAADELNCSGVVLDFQRPDNSLTRAVAETVCNALPCPLAVSSAYAEGLDCAVFLPPPGLREDVPAYFTPWKKREIWLEVYDQWEIVTVMTEAVECNAEAPVTAPELLHYDDKFHCRYALEVLEDRVVFTLHRGIEQWQESSHPVTNLIGLWQDYGL